jgi:hypothetical protein
MHFIVEWRRRVQRLETIEVNIDQEKPALPGLWSNGTRRSAHFLARAATVIANIGFQTAPPQVKRDSGESVEREFNENGHHVESVTAVQQTIRRQAWFA